MTVVLFLVAVLGAGFALTYALMAVMWAVTLHAPLRAYFDPWFWRSDSEVARTMVRKGRLWQ